MTSKKTAKTTVTAEKVAPQVVGTLAFDKADIVAIKVQEFEQGCTRRLNETRQAIQVTQAQIRNADEVYGKAFNKFTSELHLKIAAELSAGFAVTLAKEFAKVDVDAKGATSTTSSAPGGDEDILSVVTTKLSVHCYSADGSSGGRLTFTRTNALSEDLVRLQLATLTLKEDIAKLRNREIEEVKRLAQLPAVERKFRAELAKAYMGQSKEGKELLERLRDVDDVLTLV